MIDTVASVDEQALLLVPAPALAHVQNLEVNVVTREVFVTEEITEGFGGWFTLTLKYLEAQSHEAIRIWVNTPGGDVQSMFTFHDLVQASPCHITTIGTGQVCSAGVLMLACGNRRLVTESAILMSHRGEDSLMGSLEAMEAQIKVAKWAEEHWAQLMSRYTPKDAKYWFQLGKKNAEWWVTGGEQIVAEGIADAVYGRDNV